MDKANIRSYNTTLKKMISIAKNLAKNEIPIIYELGHYLADNVLSKICMVVMAENNRIDLIFKNKRDGRTYDFPILYKNMQQNFPWNLKSYDEIVKDFHIERSVYQHRFESLKQTFRQPEAEKYVEFVIDTMRKTKILGSGESLPYIRLMNKNLTHQDYQINHKQRKYQELYNILKNPQSDDININLIIKLDFAMIQRLKEDLIIDHHGSGRNIKLHNSKWSIEIRFNETSIHNEKSNETFSYGELINNQHVLEEFLKYFRDCLKEQGINIKD